MHGEQTTLSSHEVGTDFIVEIDLYYPKRLHDAHRFFPLALERMTITREDLSPEMQDKAEVVKPTQSAKLVGTLNHKEKYVVDMRALRLYLKLGMRPGRVYRVVVVSKKAWLKPYIDLCTSKRQTATTKFEKDFWKLMVNCVYGKVMENKRNHSNVKIVLDRIRAMRLLRKPLFKQFEILTEDKALFMMQSSCIKMDKPMYVGFTVLEYSKMLMYELYYEVFSKRYPNQLTLLYTDTDSFIFKITTQNLYDDFAEPQFRDILDNCDYPKDHPLYSEHNKKVLGKIKDETNGLPIRDFVALKAKMHAFRVGNETEKRAKGITRAVVRDNISWVDYYNCLFDSRVQSNIVTNIRSTNHILNTVRTLKLSLSPFDDKRYYLNNIESVPWGHYSIPGTNVQLVPEFEQGDLNWFNLYHDIYRDLSK